jgi:putative ABC transport system permease protein
MNDFHTRKNDIHLLTIQQSPESELVAIEASLFFKFDYKDFPDIEALTCIKKYQEGEIQFKFDNAYLSAEGIVTDSMFFRIFDFRLLEGEAAGVLNNPNALILSQKFAKKLFGNNNPIGKTIELRGQVQNTFTVQGIIEDQPANSSLTFDFILPDHPQRYSRTGAEFILSGTNFDKSRFTEKIRDMGHIHHQFKESRMDILNFGDIYFSNDVNGFNNIFSKFGNKKNIRILIIIIGVIYIITLLNFTNLQIININASLKNIGINKITGAENKDLILQKITELVVLILFSSILISGAFKIVLPYFNKMVGVELSPNTIQLFCLNIAVLSILFVSAMVYPSILYLRITMTSCLKRELDSVNIIIGRNILVIVQFSLSIVLLIASFLVVKQLNFMLSQDLGFNTKNIILVKFFSRIGYSNPEEYKKLTDNQNRDYQYIINELTNNSLIKSFAQGRSPVNSSVMPWKRKNGTDHYTDGSFLGVTPGYELLLGLTISEGRFFDNTRDISRGNQVVINETAKKQLGITDISQESILNKYWSTTASDALKGFEIIGVIRDFNSGHLSSKPEPLFMMYFQDIESDYLIQFEEGATSAGLQFVNQLFKQVNPEQTFQYTFLEDDIGNLYHKEKRLKNIYVLFTFIALSISMIGLYAISLFDTRRRTKEIGIRKVNGATIAEVLMLLNRDFVKWVAIAFVIATPIAWYTMHKWLQNFAYKTELSWWIFGLAGLLALGIALLTVSFQSWKAATRNPVEALRYE